MTQPENMTLQAIVEQPRSDSGTGSGGGKKTSSLSDRFSWPGRIALLVAIVLSPWAFASVENWAQAWIEVALLVGLAFWWFETALNNRSSQVFPYVSVLVFVGLGIGLIQTISVPDGIAQLLLGRQQEIYNEFSGNTDSGASISLDREGTWYQIRLLVIAVSGLLLGCRYFRAKRDIMLLLSVVTINGVAIGFFGVIHKLTDNGKMFWIRPISAGMPFGPFVNRNNSAGYLLMCLGCCLGLLAIVMAKRKNRGAVQVVSKEIPIWRQWYFHSMAFIAELTGTKTAVLLSAIMIAAAIPSSLSRGGVVGLLVASIGTILVFGMARKPKNFGLILTPIICFVLALFGWIGFGDELLKRFDRIDTVNVSEADGRIQQWKDTWPAVGEMGLLGSGLGSYEHVHRLYRTGPENALFVYAENQYFQSLVEAGWPGLLLFLLAWLLAYKYASLALFRGNSSTTIGVGTMGVFVVFSQAVVSCFDFGLYIPSNMLLFAVLIGFLAYHSHALAGRLKKQSWLRFLVPNYLVQVIILVLFAGGTMVAMDLFRRSALDRLMIPRSVQLNRFNMDLKQADARIAAITARIQRTPTVEALNYAGELWMHRSRLAMFQSLTELPEFENAIAVMDESEKNRQTENLWNLTDVLSMQEQVAYLRREQSRFELKKYLDASAIQKNLPLAKSFFEISRQASPLQPLVHLRIGEIKGVIGDVHAGDVDIETALKLAPSNPVFRKVAGIYYLQSGNVEAAIPHFKAYLELLPQRFLQLMSLLTGRTSRNLVPVDDQIIARIIPDDGRMLYEYVARFLPQDSPLKSDLLVRASRAVADLSYNIRENDVLMGDIQKAQGDLENAADSYRSALIRQPNDPNTRYKRGLILLELGELEEALEEAKYLKSHSDQKSTYNKFFDDVKKAISNRDSEKK